jgi:hypothetical protein
MFADVFSEDACLDLSHSVPVNMEINRRNAASRASPTRDIQYL